MPAEIGADVGAISGGLLISLKRGRRIFGEVSRSG
jgi:hypothetical protein